MIDLVDIYVSFEGQKALDGLSLHVKEGTLLGVIGPGGSGKSTMCKVIAALVAPLSGETVVDGINLNRASSKEITLLQQKIGIQFQNDALFEHMTVLDNIAYPLKRLTDKSDDEIEDLAKAQVSMVGLSGFERNMPGSMSGGQRRRVALARACVTNPSLLICDDPTAGLDPVTSRRILDMIAGIRVQSRSTVVVVSSDIPGLLSVADRVALVWGGKVIEEESTFNFKKSTKKESRRFLDDAALPFADWSWE